MLLTPVLGSRKLWHPMIFLSTCPRSCFYVCVCVCIYTYIYIHIHTHIHIHVYICLCVHLHIDLYTDSGGGEPEQRQELCPGEHCRPRFPAARHRHLHAPVCVCVERERARAREHCRPRFPAARHRHLHALSLSPYTHCTARTDAGASRQEIVAYNALSSQKCSI